MEAAIENSSAVGELTLEDISRGVVEAHLGIPGGHKKVVTEIREAEIRDSIRGRRRELPP